QDATGKWRISGIDSGIILAGAHFDDLFRPVEIAFASADGKVVVPDLRWVPRSNSATFAANALLGGPSAWLADAVRTGIPVTAALTLQAVPITDGRALVALDTDAGGNDAQRALARLQFAKTLTQLPDITSVEVTIGGLVTEGDGTVQLDDAPIPGTTAVAFVNGRLGTWAADALTVVPPGAGALPAGANSPALSYDGKTVAFLIGSSQLVTTDALAAGTVALDPAGAAPEGVMPVTVAYSGSNLTMPSFDWYGWVWTAERSGSGSLVALAPGAAPKAVSVPWLEGREVGAVRVSHDGARVAVLSREGGVWRLDVAGLIRDADGMPLSVGQPLSVGLGVGPASHLVWVDGRTLAVLADGPAGSTPSLGISVVGGGTTVLSSSADAIEIAARNRTSSIAVVTRQGEIFQSSTAGWSKVPLPGAVEGLAFSG
ncbi:MAG TPA: LpqB family beta-propeller domain-containing protein, partial [Demequinaceae bacterium]